jgi:hypothetical protein
MSKRKRNLEVRAEASCETCPPSPCCKGPTWIDLDREELKFMVKGGNNLIPIVLPDNKDRYAPTPVAMSTKTGRVYAVPDLIPAGKGRYVMPNDCAYLKPDENGDMNCSAYDDRPFACQKYEVGGNNCHIVRQLFDIEPIPVGSEAEVLIQMKTELDIPQANPHIGIINL